MGCRASKSRSSGSEHRSSSSGAACAAIVPFDERGGPGRQHPEDWHEQILTALDAADREGAGWKALPDLLPRDCEDLDVTFQKDPARRRETSLLCEAAAAGHTTLVAAVLGAGASIDGHRERGCRHPPVFLAARHGHAATLELLLARGSSPYPTDRGHPLAAAARYKHLEAVNVLIAANACAEGRGDSTSPSGTTALYSAVANEDMAVATALLDAGVDPEARRADGDTAMMSAARRGNKDLVCLLMERGADPRTLAFDGSTPMAMAALHHANLLAVMLKHVQAVAAADRKAKVGESKQSFAEMAADDAAERKAVSKGRPAPFVGGAAHVPEGRVQGVSVRPAHRVWVPDSCMPKLKKKR